MITLWQDLRYGARMLIKHKGLTIIAILSLALGIGANTAIFSLVDALLLKSLPVKEPAALAQFKWVAMRGFGVRVPDYHGSSRPDEATGLEISTSFPQQTFEQFRAQQIPRPIQPAEYTENPGAEELFAADAGAPLDKEAQDTIGEVFRASDNVNVQDIYCKNSICKITYSKSQSGMDAGDDSDFALIDQLTDGLGGTGLDIRYAKDEHGNDVMYVQRN